MIISGTKDWFEFILDFSLLDRHLSENKTAVPSGCSLIIQFLYHANMTEQLYNTNYQNAVQLNNQLAKVAAEQTPESLAAQTQANVVQVELKAKRIRALRVLAIKAAAILDWDLLLFEKEVPIAVMSDLLHIFLRLTFNEAETSPHSQLDLTQLSNYSIFALQLLHRWCIRTVIASKFYKKPPTKYVPINLPSSLNPLQHMKEANESILKVLFNSVRESVEFLEKCLKEVEKDICKPISECFSDVNSSLELNWDKSVPLKQQEIKICISYDLAMYYFQNEEYKKSMDLLINVQVYLREINDESSISKLNAYTADLESYLIACRSILGEFDDVNEDNLDIVGDNYTKQAVKKIVKIESCVKREEFHKLADFLCEDVKSCQLSNSFRLNLEVLIEQTNNRELQAQLAAFNLLQSIAHSNYFRSQNLADLRHLPKILERCFDSLSTTGKANIKAFLHLNQKRLDRQSLEILKSIKGLDVQIDANNETSSTDEEMVSDSTPSSPPPSSSIVNNLNNRENTNLSYAKLSLQTCDPIILKNCITKYNFIQSNKNISANGLRYFWPKWHKLLGNLYSSNQEAANLIITSTFLNTLLKTNSVNEMDFFFIASAKLIELVMAKKFDCVTKLMSSMEESLSSSVKSTKFFSNIQLYVNIWMHLNQMNILKSDSQQKLTNQDQLIKGCKSVLLSFKNDLEVSHELLRSVFVFVLSMNEFGLLQSSEIGFLFSSSQPKVNPSLAIPNTMFNISKHLSKLCSEIPKGDKNALRKIARDLWNVVVELFTDTLPTTKKIVQEQPSTLVTSQPYDVAASSLSSFNPSSASSSSSAQQQASRDNQMLFTSRELIRKLFLSIRNGLVNSVIMSLLSTLYNVADSSANNDIFSEYRYLWPSSLANSNSLNLACTNDILNSLLTMGFNEMEACNANWLHSYADIRMSKCHFNDAIKLFLQYLICETKHFFNLNALTNRTTPAPQSKENKALNEVVIDERIFKSIIKSCVQLNKHTQAALLYQLIPNNDYANAFRCLQESSYITPASDEMDTLYSCIWDLTLLEYLCNLNYTRGFLNKKNQCLKLLAAENLNASNPPEIYQKTIELKKSSLFLKLVEHYFLF